VKSGTKRVKLAVPARVSDYPYDMPINICVVNNLLERPVVFGDETTLRKWGEHLGRADLKLWSFVQPSGDEVDDTFDKFKPATVQNMTRRKFPFGVIVAGFEKEIIYPTLYVLLQH